MSDPTPPFATPDQRQIFDNLKNDLIIVLIDKFLAGRVVLTVKELNENPIGKRLIMEFNPLTSSFVFEVEDKEIPNGTSPLN